MSDLLRIDKLSKSWGGVKAVSDASFALEEGEILALIGPNGAGKSTCFNMINGQIEPDAGQVLLRGINITRSSPRAKWRVGIGRTFQISRVFSSMTVLECVQVAMCSYRTGISNPLISLAQQNRGDAIALLARLGLEGHTDTPCNVLAYGDIKRVEFAIALASEPSILLMDEPTAGMASKERFALMELVDDVRRERSLSVLFTEHDMDIVFNHADRIIVLDRGQVIAAGSSDEIRSNQTVRDVYLGSSHTTSLM